jgi:transcriptional regulator with XRE-family HTH domain
MTDPVDDSEFARAELRRLGGGPGAIAERIHVDRKTARQWLSGERRPSYSARQSILEAYGIAIEAWGQVTATREIARPAPAPAYEPDEDELDDDEDPSPLAQCERMLEAIKRDLRSPSLRMSERLRLRAEQGRTISMLARLQRDGEMLEDRIVREHPSWRRIRAALLDALSPHPDALASVVEALRKLDA